MLRLSFRPAQKPPAAPTWRDAQLFVGLTPSEMDWLERHIVELQLAPEQILVREGDTGHELYAILTGQLSVTKREEHSTRAHELKVLGPGDVAGELEVLDPKGRAATVTALSRCRIAVVNLQQLRHQDASPTKLAEGIYFKLVANLASSVAAKLRDGSADAVHAAHRRSAMGELIVNVIILLCLYVLLVASLSSLGLKPNNTMVISLPLLLVFGFASWRFIRTSGYPVRTFGLTLRGLPRSIGESIVATLLLLLLTTGIKWILLQTDSAYEQSRLIQYPDVLARLSSPRTRVLVAVYALSAAVQEFIVRGALQSMLQQFLVGPRALQKAILVCALLFSVSHLHTGVLFPLLVFLPGVLWGWLFARHRNIVGVTLSHVALGAYVFFVLGIKLAS